MFVVYLRTYKLECCLHYRQKDKRTHGPLSTEMRTEIIYYREDEQKKSAQSTNMNFHPFSRDGCWTFLEKIVLRVDILESNKNYKNI